MMQVTGGCHCKAVRFTAEIEDSVSLLICNCSICEPIAYEHLIVPEAKFTLEAADDALTSYRFGSGEAEHLFCKICGVKSYYWPRSHPGCVSVNFRGLDDQTGITVEREIFDGKNWEKSKLNLR